MARSGATARQSQAVRNRYDPVAGAKEKPGLNTGFNSFLAAGPVGLAVRLGWRYGVDRRYLPRYLGILAADAVFAPLRAWQSVAYGGRIRRAEVDPEPLFLLGFWRSGTTLLHNLLAMDERWGYVSTFQAALPDAFLAGRGLMRRLIESRLPPNRGADNIPVDLAMPQEEEIALMCSCGLSPYVSLNFPRTGEDTLEYLFPGEGLSRGQRERWQAEYIKLLKAASYHMGGKPLALKSPSNTSRVAELLGLFPKARFVYLQRNPYDTLRSYVHLLRLMNGWHALQSVDFDELLGRQVKIYRRMAEAYLEQRALIPEGRLVEIRYEELERDKMGQVRVIYEGLGLEGYDEFEPRLAEYVASIADFQKNPAHISPEVIELVNEHVPFLVSQYGYEFMDGAADGGGGRDTI